jgi:hypothetical protein
MKKSKQLIVSLILSIALMYPQPSRADLFGGDVAVLVQILANSIQQLAQLRQILGNGAQTLGLLQDINRGVRDGLTVIQMMDPKFNPGLYGDLATAERVLAVINDLYGRIPVTGDAKLQRAQDQSVAESIAMNGTLYQFADQADQESRRIIDHSQVVSPQGAAKLTAQSVAILIGVTTQLLRSNSMMLKMMAENMALQNRKDKLESAQFRTQYDGISSALGALPKETGLKPLDGGS